MPPPLSFPRGRRSALRRRPCRRQHSSFPRPTRSHAHHCSRLTREHGGEQSGMVTLTFDLFTLKVVSESRVTYLCANFGLPRPLCSWLRPDVRDRQTSDKCQTKASLNAPPIRGGGIIRTGYSWISAWSQTIRDQKMVAHQTKSKRLNLS